VQFLDRALVDGRTIRVCETDRADGDLAVDSEPVGLELRRRAIIDRPWLWLRQVHGAQVVVVGAHEDVADLAGREADASVTTRSDVALAVQSADCGTVALWTDDGAIGAIHAGWRGLDRGAIAAAAAAVRGLSSQPLHAFVGPCIGPECYEFGAADLERMRSRFGDGVAGTTTSGVPALDVRACISRALDDVDVDIVAAEPACTACDAQRFWSHRARADRQRQALVIWIEQP
jgi:YfiH family protein